MIRFLIILFLVVSMIVFSVACTQTDSEAHPNNNAGTPDYDDPALSAPAEDLLYIELAGNQHDDGTFEYLDSVMFVFEGEHDFFSLQAITHWGRLLSFEDMIIHEREYSLTKGDTATGNSTNFDGKTGFLLFFEEEITKPGMYVISFEYLGVMVEAELAVVTGSVN